MPVGASQSTVADDGRRRAGHLWDMLHRLKAYVTRGIYMSRKGLYHEIGSAKCRGSQKKYTTGGFAHATPKIQTKRLANSQKLLENPPGFYFVNNLQVIVSASDHLRAPPCPKAKEP